MFALLLVIVKEVTCEFSFLLKLDLRNGRFFFVSRNCITSDHLYYFFLCGTGQKL